MPNNILRYELIPDRLREVRDHLGLTQQELADSLGLSKSAISNIEAGTKRYSIETAALVAEAGDTTIDYLTGAPWVNNPRRDPDMSVSSDAMEAARIMDELTPTMRTNLLYLMREYAKVAGALTRVQRELIRHKLAIAEVDGVDVDRLLAEITVDEATVGQFLIDSIREAQGKL